MIYTLVMVMLMSDGRVNSDQYDFNSRETCLSMAEYLESDKVRDKLTANGMVYRTMATCLPKGKKTS